MSEKTNKDVTLRFRVSKEESNKIDKLCKIFKMSKSELIRCVMLGKIENPNFILEMGNLPIIRTWAYVKDKIGVTENILDNEIQNIKDSFKNE
ncbi:MAG: hypothetical protein WCY75_06685 [Sulfurimonadaceae bacterium]